MGLPHRQTSKVYYSLSMVRRCLPMDCPFVQLNRYFSSKTSFSVHKTSFQPLKHCMVTKYIMLEPYSLPRNRVGAQLHDSFGPTSNLQIIFCAHIGNYSPLFHPAGYRKQKGRISGAIVTLQQ